MYEVKLGPVLRAETKRASVELDGDWLQIHLRLDSNEVCAFDSPLDKDWAKIFKTHLTKLHLKRFKATLFDENGSVYATVTPNQIGMLKADLEDVIRETNTKYFGIQLNRERAENKPMADVARRLTQIDSMLDIAIRIMDKGAV